ncbi:MAG: LLM class flavin-dependent oxidoreductase [Actinomycetota bacterium]
MADVQFGLVLSGQFLPDDDPQRALGEMLEQVLTARDAGFDAIFTTQHFLSDFQFFQPLLLLSRIAAVSGDMKLGTAVTLLSYYPPVLFAEEVATLDIISGGRVILGVGTGYREEEFAAMGVPRSERIARFEEALPVLRALWSGEPVSHDGRFTLEEATLRLRPPQGEKIPIWVGATGPQGIARAARMGDEWLISPEMPLNRMRENKELFIDALEEQSPQDHMFPVLREAFVADDKETAIRIAREPLETKYAAYRRWGHEVGEFDEMTESTFVLGDADECTALLSRYVTEYGSSFIGLRMQWPGMTHRDVLSSIERFGADVLPRVR